MGVTVTLPSPLDRFGNITLPGRGGISWVVQFQVLGVPTNVAGNAIFFEVDGILRVAFGPTPTGDRSLRMLQLDDAQVAALPLSNYPFQTPAVPYVIRDETGSVPIAMAWGSISVTGFTAQPPNGPT